MKPFVLFSVITVAATVLACSFVGHAADSPDLVASGMMRVEGADGTPLGAIMKIGWGFGQHETSQKGASGETEK
jgi:hypothetical protein